LVYFSAKHQEIWDITNVLENHKPEIADWDIGAGIYIDYFIIKNSMQEDNAMNDDSVSILFLQNFPEDFPINTSLFLSFRIHLRRKMNHARVSSHD
jgi:hypothetical protein